MGYHAGTQCTAKHWAAGLDMAINRQFPAGARGYGLSLMSHNGCQPASAAFMRACATLDVHQVFTSCSSPNGNADTERVMRKLKEECLWLQEWTCPFELLRVAVHSFSHGFMTQAFTPSRGRTGRTPVNQSCASAGQRGRPPRSGREQWCENG
jgi:transposase InsO family protein